MFKKSETQDRTAGAQSKNNTLRPTTIIRNQEPTPIGPTVHIVGDIRGNQDLLVHGQIEGTIDLGEGLLMVTGEGQVKADVSARVINIEGRAEGRLEASEQIIVRRSARVRGSIKAPRISLDFGCSFCGSIDTDVVPADTAAIRDDKIADFKSAIATSAEPPVKSAAGKAAPR